MKEASQVSWQGDGRGTTGTGITHGLFYYWRGQIVPLLLLGRLLLVVVERGQELVYIQVNGKAVLQLLPFLEVTKNKK